MIDPAFIPVIAGDGAVRRTVALLATAYGAHGGIAEG